jgi:hypothetical protein
VSRREVRVNPVFYSRLLHALADLRDAVDAEVEIVAQLPSIIDQIATTWDNLPVLRGDTSRRAIDGTLNAIPAVYSIEAKERHDTIIEIRSIRVVLDPTT